MPPILVDKLPFNIIEFEKQRRKRTLAVVSAVRASSAKPLVRSCGQRAAFNLDARLSLQWHVPAKAHLKSGFVLP
jgi:hypothetical protein